MAEKRKATTTKRLKLEKKPPTLNERITDFSKGAYSGHQWVPKKKK